jgi:hypothetical protein
VNPIAIGFFGAQAEMAEASHITHLVEQLPFDHSGCILTYLSVLWQTHITGNYWITVLDA